jgi:hypothetical protein
MARAQGKSLPFGDFQRQRVLALLLLLLGLLERATVKFSQKLSSSKLPSGLLSAGGVRVGQFREGLPGA